MSYLGLLISEAPFSQVPYIFKGTAVEEWDMFVLLNIFFPPKHKLIFHDESRISNFDSWHN
jgi:hypothetical protein